jgi:hypothetical protein
MPRIAAGIAASIVCTLSAPAALAWSDPGHEVVGLIADHYLKPAVRQKVQAMLAGDTTDLARSTGVALHVNLDKTAELRRETFTA